MKGAIVSQFQPVRAVLRQLIHSIAPEITMLEHNDSMDIETLIQNHGPAFIIMSLPSETDGGLQRTGRIKSKFPEITLAIMASYDFPEYAVASKSLGIDYLLSEQEMDRQIIERILKNIQAPL